MKRTAYLFYIGQSPRPDIFDEVRAAVPADIELTQCGALDGLSTEEIRRVKPENDADTLITKLNDGSSVIVSEKAIQKLLEQKMNALSSGKPGAKQLCALLCTGAFDSLHPDMPFIAADTAFHEKMEFADAVKNLGVIVPLEEQRTHFAALFAHYGLNVLTAAADPYGPLSNITDAAASLKKQGADCICLDCMGYDCKIADAVNKATGLDARIPRLETAKQIKAFFEYLQPVLS